MVFRNSRFHACATCRHFGAHKQETGMQYRCERLGFDTKPGYRFDCWEPRKHIVNLMEKEAGKQSKEKPAGSRHPVRNERGREME